jgi:gliding motility-associated-like protein
MDLSKYLVFSFLLLSARISFSQTATVIHTDGLNDYITIPQVVSGNFTIEYWLKTTQTGNTGTGQTANWWTGKGIVDGEVAFWANDFGTSLYGSKLAFGVGGPASGSDVTIFSSTNINSGNWVHVAVSWQQSTKDMKLYINGVLEATGTSTNSSSRVSPTIKIGVLQTGLNFFNGYIDELRIWNTVRTGTQITSNMFCELDMNVTQTGLVSYYRFNQGIAAGNNSGLTTLLDLSGNTNNGTLTNFALNGSSSNWVGGSPMNILAVGISGANPICFGNSTTLTASGALSYTWNTGATSSVLVINPTSNTSYSVIGKSGTCIGTNVITVTVYPTPLLFPIPASTTICNGGTLTLSVIGASSYSWLPMAVIGSSVVVSPSISTTYTVFGANPVGCISSTILPVSVSTTPTLVVSPANPTICSNVISTISVSGASNYTWMPGNLSGSSVTLNLGSSAVYTITGENGAGCKSVISTTVSVVQTPTVTASSAPTVICLGSTSTLTASGANTYTWQPGNLSGPVQTVNPVSFVIYTVTGEINGCKATSNVTVNNSVNPLISLIGNLDCLNSTVQLQVTSNSSLNTITWSGPGIVGNNTSTAITINSAGLYSATVTNTLTGCIGTGTINVINSAGQLSLNVVSSSSLTCFPGPSVNILVSNPASYTWFPPGATTPGTGPLVSTNPSVTTSYTVMATQGVCTGSAAVTITVNPTPTVSIIVPAQTICVGSIFNLAATGANSYTWLPGKLPGNSVTVTPYTTTVYTVTGQSENCYDSDTVRITTKPTPTITTVASPPVICGGSSILNAFGAETYTWLPTINGNTFIVTPTVTTIYSVSGTNSMNCTSQATVLVNVSSAFTLEASGSSSIICAGETITLSAQGGQNHSWNPPGTSSGNLITVTPSVTTVYTLTAQNGACSAMKFIPVTVSDCAKAIFGVTNAADTPLGVNSEYYKINFTVTAVNASNLMLSDVRLEDDLVKTFPGPSTYTIVNMPTVRPATSLLTLNKNFDGSSEAGLTMSASSSLAPNSRDSITFTLLLDPKGIFGESRNWVIGSASVLNKIQLRDSSNNGFTWDPDSDGNPTNNNAVTIIDILPFELFIPNGFSPNGDGFYDNFRIRGLNSRPIKLTVYNRWGNKVYDKEPYDNSWNGNGNISNAFGNGLLPAGTYYYIIQFLDGKKENKTGFVELRY